MTANVLPQQVASFKDAGMDDHIGKPYRKKELEEAIVRWGRPSDQSRPGLGQETFVDEEALREVEDMLGTEHFLRLVASLTRELTERFQDLSRKQLEFDAHAMVSASGALGLNAFSDACREIMTLCRSDAEVGGDALQRFEAARSRRPSPTSTACGIARRTPASRVILVGNAAAA